MRFREISEARRNPTLNTAGKELVMHTIKKYAGMKDVFGSYTADVGIKSHRKLSARNASGFKLGVNPDTEWDDTPAGIYAYPIDYIIQRKRDVPFAKNKPFLIVFKASGNMVVGSTYTKEDLKSDILKLKIIAERNHWDEEKCNFMLNEFPAQDEYKPIEYLWKIVSALSIISKRKFGYWNKLFRELGYDGIIDDGIGFIHRAEPVQALFFTKPSLKILEVIKNKTFNANTIGFDPDEDFDED